MSEYGPRAIGFGDVVRCASRNPDTLYLVTDNYKNGWLGGIGLLSEANHRYELPGSIMQSDVTAVVDTKTYDEVIEIAAHIFGDKEELVDKLRSIALHTYPRPSNEQ